MKAGKLRHRITIERFKSGIQDPETGDIVSTWVVLQSAVPAGVEPVSGREFMASAATQSRISTRITVRYRDVNSSDRIVYRGHIYNIEAVLPDKVSGLDYLTLMCTDGSDHGQ